MPDTTARGRRHPRRLGTRGWFSAQSTPAWLNQATMKGAVLVAAGMAILALRDGDRWLNELLGLMLIAWSISEAWFRLSRLRDQRTWDTVAFPLVLFIGGIVLTLGFGLGISVLFGATLLARSAVLAVAKLTRSPDLAAHGWLTVSATAITGAAMVALPETSVLGIRALAGGASILMGGILLMLGLTPEGEEQARDLDLHGVGRLASDWLQQQRVGEDRVEVVGEGLFFEHPRRLEKQSSFWVMMVLAAAIATFAVVQDSTAVVIGAMLVAPLMTPIMGMAVSIVNGWTSRLRDSTLMTAAAVAVAIAVAWIIGAWLPGSGDLLTNSQVTSRVSPNLLDLCIALAAGAAGAYATVNPRVSSSLSGVAIAVALVPPLAVVGLTLEAGLGEQATGASVLFLTNLVCIILSGSIVLVLTGYSPFPTLTEGLRRQRRAVWSVGIAAVIVMIPLGLTSKDIWTNSNNRADTVKVVDQWLAGSEDLSAVEIKVDDTKIDITLTGASAAPPVTELESALVEAIGEPIDLKVRVVPSELLGS